MTRAPTARPVLLLLALLPLAGCGRAGPPRVPGPREAVTYPRAYPAPDPLPPMSLPPEAPSPAEVNPRP